MHSSFSSVAVSLQRRSEKRCVSPASFNCVAAALICLWKCILLKLKIALGSRAVLALGGRRGGWVLLRRNALNDPDVAENSWRVKIKSNV